MFFMLILVCFVGFFSLGRCRNTLRYKVIDDAVTRNALCNDGSIGVYYIHTNSKSDNWLIFLQGGGGCYSTESCNERYQKDRSLMTSVDLPLHIDGHGIMSDNCTENPGFCNDNIVMIHYCSSDWWSGNNDLMQTQTYYFYGHNIVKSVVEDLFKKYEMHKAKRVVLTGSSAGGVGTFSNSDYVAAQVRGQVPDAEYSIIPDSGWFLDGDTLKPWPCTTNEKCAYEHRLRAGQDMWNIIPHEKCGDHYNVTEKWRCLVGYHLYPFVESRKMVIFYIYDLWQAGQDGVAGKTKISQMTEEEKAWVSKRGDFVINAIKDLEIEKNGGMWVQGCYWHGTVGSDSLYSETKTLDGVTPNDAVVEFLSGKNPNHADLSCTSVKCNSDCPGGN